MKEEKEEKKDPAEPLEWLNEFAAKVASKAGPTAIAHSLVQVGVANPREPNEFPGDKLFDWLHQNQLNYNATVRVILDSRPGLRKQLRRVLLRDLGVVTDLEGYGKIVLKSYGRALLDHFLTARPNPKWVG